MLSITPTGTVSVCSQQPCPASPPYLGVPLPQFQHHEGWAVFGVLGVLIQKQVLEDERLGPRGGYRVSQVSGALAVVQEDQPNEGSWGVEGEESIECLRLFFLAAASTRPGTQGGPGGGSHGQLSSRPPQHQPQSSCVGNLRPRIIRLHPRLFYTTMVEAWVSQRWRARWLFWRSSGDQAGVKPPQLPFLLPQLEQPCIPCFCVFSPN